MINLKTVFTASALLVALAFSATTAEAGGTSGAFVLTNPTSNTIHYQVKWGESSEWKSYSLPPHSKRAHYRDLKLIGGAQPYVRFDYIGGNGMFDPKTYKVGFYSVFDPWNGKQYVFRYSSSGQYLNLYYK